MVYNSLGVLKWNSANKKRYTSLGYIFTRQGDEFLVNIKDLTHRSSAIIEIKCDYCNEIFVRPYNNYVRSFCNAILKRMLVTNVFN
jgi:formylmethanofuran dehydrogenase subunit E